MLNMSIFGNTADVYAIVYLVPHACQHITVGHICYYCLLAANQGDQGHGFFLKQTWRVSPSISVRITMIHCVVYLLRISKMFHGLMNNPVYIYIYIYLGLLNTFSTLVTRTPTTEHSLCGQNNSGLVDHILSSTGSAENKVT
jgi:hypothetical protein